MLVLDYIVNATAASGDTSNYIKTTAILIANASYCQRPSHEVQAHFKKLSGGV